VNANGALRNVSGANTLSGTVVQAAASEMQNDAGSLTLGNTVGGAFALDSDGAAGTTTTMSGVVGGAAALSLVKNGTGTLTCRSQHLYRCDDCEAGVLSIQNATATGTVAGGVTVASGAALELQGGHRRGAEALTLRRYRHQRWRSAALRQWHELLGRAITLGVAPRANQFRRYARSLDLSGGVTTPGDDECGRRRDTTFNAVAITGAAGSSGRRGTAQSELNNTIPRDGDFSGHAGAGAATAFEFDRGQRQQPDAYANSAVAAMTAPAHHAGRQHAAIGTAQCLVQYDG